MENLFCLIICLFLSATGKYTNNKPPHGHRSGVDSNCALTKKAAIKQPGWDVEHNKTVYSLGVILRNSSLENVSCLKLSKTSSTKRTSRIQHMAEKPYSCVFVNSCAATENQVKLTIMFPPDFRKNHQSDFKGSLARTCRAANGSLAPGIVLVKSMVSMRGRNGTKQQNRTRTVTSIYKPVQHTKSLEKVTCLINLPTPNAPTELILGCPFVIAIKKNKHIVQGKKRKFNFNITDSEQIIEFKITGFVDQINLICSKQNDSLPEGIELIENKLKFKAPLKEYYAGMYMCEASYQHWTKKTYWEIEITPAENQWLPTKTVLPALCIFLAASVCVCCVLRWHRRKKLVVIPKQYSIQNIGYQATRDAHHCIKTRQDVEGGVSRVTIPQDSQRNTGPANTTQESMGHVDGTNVFQVAKEDGDASEDSKQHVKSPKLDASDKEPIV
ncbi:nectin-1-like isoform X1 [Chiloscyllium plagiosum]|uniref:nectin-1-like isoform X1 n=1 Tax=Chiloscyllium plagiosum TaxID=36176 RepID=UPI001CB7C02B|nr:nectin-1-like isoform X1 [Chiloscyllium plagiosum]